MNDRVIEPSEIIIEKTHKPQENIVHVNPWIRCIARFFDYSLFCLVLLGIKKLCHDHIPLRSYDRFIPFEFFVWIPVEAVLLSTWGTTPGKWFLKTKLKAGKRRALHFSMALKRSFNVWFRGLGMGIIGLNFFCLALAYQRLKMLKITSWDREDHIQVTHYPIGRWRIYVAVFVAVAGLMYYMQGKGTKTSNHAERFIRPIHEYPSSEIAAARPHLFT
ncbi:MAG: RDD family protein [Verrucomicrobia bacterium]|nr:RDD family protein [Verrucomicrobiota bacterium]MBU6447098.1 RDD family protein [Verrucomicrobiota bacterium]MDE3047378.1 RDD family protein [Verrucomicrobiota bacterium]